MPKSEAFRRMKADVMALAAHVPEGRVTTHAEIARVLGIPARHSAFILSTLDLVEERETPWHRVTGAGGKLGGTKAAEQAQRLTAEGISCEGRVVAQFADRFLDLAAIPARTERYLDSIERSKRRDL